MFRIQDDTFAAAQPIFIEGNLVSLGKAIKKPYYSQEPSYIWLESSSAAQPILIEGNLVRLGKATKEPNYPKEPSGIWWRSSINPVIQNIGSVVDFGNISGAGKYVVAFLPGLLHEVKNYTIHLSYTPLLEDIEPAIDLFDPLMRLVNDIRTFKPLAVSEQFRQFARRAAEKAHERKDNKRSIKKWAKAMAKSVIGADD